tara:strand:- start:588 stop:1184 length:597 start_codon:yes stop_codon:yes gene_type:complete
MTILSNLAQINLMNDFFVDYLYSEDTYDILIEKNDDRVLLIGGVYGILLLSSFPIIGRWFYVSAKINHLSEVKDLEITPGWAVGWYFIPFANLVMPYRALKETFQASFDSENWQSIKIPYDFSVWWATFLASNGFSSWSANMWGSLEEPYAYEKVNQIAYIDITADVLLIINAFFLLRIVGTIFNNQKGKNFQLKKHY